MKRLITTLFLGLLFFVFSQSYAQVGDTLLLYANPTGAPIDEQINNDQANNPPPNRVYVLQQTGPIDSVYQINSDFTVKFDLTIIGKPNPVTGTLPIICPGFDASGNSPKRMFVLQNSQGKFTLKNVYISNKNINGSVSTPGWGAIWANGGDSVTIVIDHVVFDGAGVAVAVYLNSNWDKLFITNSEFRDFQYTAPYKGGVSHQGGKYPTDSIVIKNNTFFCINGKIGVGGPGYHSYVEYSHNTVFFGGVGLDIPWTDGVIRDNIFYGVRYTGADTTSYKTQTYDGSYQNNQVIAIDSLRGSMVDYGYSTEADRHLTIENNAYFWPSALTDFLSTIKSDTGTAIVAPEWLNAYDSAMFKDKTNWPNFNEQNNMNVDPGFDPSYVSQVVDTMKLYLTDWWGGVGSSNHLWGLFMDDPNNIYILPGHEVPADWVSKTPYPVPENMRYTNTALYHASTDGLPLGDLNWFPDIEPTGVHEVSSVTPNKFELSQNYPNPFNPTTMISYSIQKAGFVTLKVYNILGQKVATLQNGYQNAGTYKIDFNASTLASGVYMYKLQAGEFSQTKKMILLR